MKKFTAVLLILITVLSLTSCKVNWFDRQYDVAWWVIAVPVAVLFVVLYLFIISKTYVCPECKTKFKPKWYHLYITIHLNGSRIAKCPNCGRKGFCPPSEETED